MTRIESRRWRRKEPDFRAASADDFANARGYFAHDGKAVGEQLQYEEQSQYEEQTLVMLDVPSRRGSDETYYHAGRH